MVHCSYSPGYSCRYGPLQLWSSTHMGYIVNKLEVVIGLEVGIWLRVGIGLGVEVGFKGDIQSLYKTRSVKCTSS